MLKKWLIFCWVALLCGPMSVQGDIYTWNDPGIASFWDSAPWTSISHTGTAPSDGDHLVIAQGYAIMDNGGGVVDTSLSYYSKRIYTINPASLVLSGGTLNVRDYTFDGNNPHLRIGSGTGMSTNFQQTGGTFTAKSVTLGHNGGNVDYTISGGVYSSEFTVLGHGPGSTATMTVNGPAYTPGKVYTVGGLLDSSMTWVNTNGGIMSVGENGGDGTLNINGGFVQVISTYPGTHNPEGTNGGTLNSALTIGRSDGSTGTLNLSGGYLRTNHFVMASPGTGIANYTGGRHDSSTISVATSGGEGTINIFSGAYLRALDSAIIGNAQGRSAVNQTGGIFLLKPYGLSDPDPIRKIMINSLSDSDGMSLNALGDSLVTPMALGGYGLIIGSMLDNTFNGKSIYNISGGTLESHYNVCVAHQVNTFATNGNTLAQLNISGNAEVKILASSDTGHAGNLAISAGDGIDISGASSSQLTRAEVNIIGGSLLVEGAVHGESFMGSLNVLGSNGEITVGAIKAMGANNTAPSGWVTRFHLDVQGASTIFVNSTNSSEGTGAADLRNGLTVTQPGFLALKTNIIDLLNAESITEPTNPADLVNNTTGFNFKVNRLYSGPRKIVQLEIVNDSNTPSWDLLGKYVVNGDDGLEKGMLYVDGKYTWLDAIFKNVDSPTMADLLAQYLNDTLVETGARFSLIGHTGDTAHLLLSGDYLNMVGDTGYAWFGWDLSGFNALYNSYITLLEFNEVPEPATWLILLLGCAAIFGTGVVRRKR